VLALLPPLLRGNTEALAAEDSATTARRVEVMLEGMMEADVSVKAINRQEAVSLD
jgi:hypothetical protein